MSQAPVSVSIFIGDIPEEDTTEIFDYLRKTGSNFSFTVGDPMVPEDGDIEVVTDSGVVSIRDLADSYERHNPRHMSAMDEFATCPTCIKPLGHKGDCGPAWMPTDNR